MTSVGHCLTGLSFASLVVPRSWERKEKLAAFAAFTLVANTPDLPLPFWGHFNYRVSHSLFVNLALVSALVGLLLGHRAWRSQKAWKWVVVAGAAAWLSHLLLDSFYSHGRGVRIFWPLSDGALNLAIPWLHVLRRSSSPDLANLRVFIVEALWYGALLAACLIWRRRFKIEETVAHVSDPR
jgi:membrane-bound metal-dependent hydrolase YbcI (DUF457 family)